MITDARDDTGSVIPAWGRFLLRVAAIALPFVTFAHGGAPGLDAFRSLGDSCARLDLELVLWALVLPGIVVLVCAANMVGRQQRYALWALAGIGGTWVVVALVTLWIPFGTCNVIFGD